MDRGRLFLKSSSRPRKQRRSSTPKRYSQPKIFQSSITAKTSPVLPVLTISSECWEKSNPAVYISENSVGLNSLDISLSKHDSSSPICPFSYTEVPIKDGGVSSILRVTLSSNPLEPASGTHNCLSRPDLKLKQARDTLVQAIHPTKALFIKYTYDLLSQHGQHNKPKGFMGTNEIKDCFGICLPNHPDGPRERKFEVEEHLPPRLSGPRSIRLNQQHIRINIAESSMIKANKILHPLKQRNYLPRREDLYIANRPTLLSVCIGGSEETENGNDMELS
ncbi:hypothetical protein K7432_011663 [Basidiobolus ranarum]|uniref:Uncharacterized protein n=1 Tax=Basidiobolus ranarum TaxID=34480 RepID=A0ABR2VTI7_9FUNG